SASEDQLRLCDCEELNCAICLEFFTDPVSLDCGHNFCRSCVAGSWEKQEKNSCPECHQVTVERNLQVNVALHRGHSFLPIDEAAEIYKVPRPSRGIHSASTSGFPLKHCYSL
uniref:RING-type domain-containing protein n=1 Tax=Callorhinchus milii TaxID=7868 RepID=A0A4W3GJN2_CALMI